jgi:hypothetical protein
MKQNLSVNRNVSRGPESWAYIYVVLAVVLGIEAAVVSMITPLVFPSNIILFVVAAAVTTGLFLTNGWVQNKLIGFKLKYENKARKVP